ncbi:diguanylate cyclase [Desulfopila aestuarii]|uniref:diguanylate cyclase n=1 Tax=Desulfopila aestuarii DSM 18488 TaxID=1121416 RepID=A0A1M7YB43_9BACT|nr:diguanylate cyclase [Desulfopila aestuarii]SHO49776.1 diguanylate cyclase (GGDEF) domain-containing protein [Desulfopila aestuarii DSM 18488]
MENSEIYKRLTAESKLPSPSKVATEVIRLCYSESSSLQDIANVVETDPALSAKFLKYANSALMGTMVPITSIQRAAVRIGIRGMASMALSFSFLSQQNKCECREFNYHRYWSKSLAHAIAARALAQKSKNLDPDELFTCALLSHIGELALATAFPEEYVEILARSLGTKEMLEEEQRIFEIHHHNLSAEMFTDWGLPKLFGQAVRIHESYVADEEENEELAELAEILHLSLQIANICVLDLPLSISFDAVEKLAENYGIAAKEFGAFFEQIVLTWQEWGYLFQIPTQQCPLYHQLKTLDANSIEAQVRSRPETEILLLAVDDDPLTLLNLTRILGSESRQIITAENGKQALQIALEKRPEMVITDWRMPQMDGLELCMALRQETTTQHTYIIMLTGAEADDELVQAFDAGADDYVVKPFTPKVLEARIRGGERLIRYQRKINRDREVIQKYAVRLGVANRKLHTMTDALTGLPNRRNAMARLKDVVAESSRYGEKLSCIMIDVDHFKNINDTHGHDNGDLVLKEVAQIFSKNARSYDMVSRMGGEEFLVISTRSDREESLQLAERLRAAVEKHVMELGGGTVAQVTISAGVASWRDEYANGGELIKAADDALYRAKKNGRNRVETAW